ncbi:alpha/beta hydrolase [Streptomyces rubiginosohelvolus]|uniref:Alpha/beta hydrolase n=1 Tax=Streptomyces rubiginosohelvolus TaxID=67362 RepID=A0ABQ3BXX5_9ACTN|nr:Alpha/beta hydrolase family protein [Streptomyces sp. NP10]GGS07331.1 alpha/beta hydrolase [Streptomyces rubiginosohelvolus]GGZ58183.1 alpha/beta hydrolase [Streptomyces pluricolorescens]
MAVTSILGVGAAAVAAGRYASDVALKATPGRPLPADRRLTVHATAAGQVTLTRSLSALRPGTWGIAGPGVHAVVGPVVDGASEGADTVVRRLESVGQGILEPGVKVRLTPALYGGDPGSDLGLDHQEVEIPGELGPLPAWYVPGARDTWIITVHGLGTTRAQPMNLMPFLHQQRFPVLDLAHRGDPGAPRPADGLGHFGASEWRDLDAALRYALRYGARNVIVHGWSTGATMALYAAVESPLRDRISGIVLDSPVLDWPVTLRALAAARGVPAALLPLAVRAAQGRTGMGATPVLETSVPASLRTPTLILHGPDDTIAPWGPSRELAARRADLVSLHAVPQAPHASMWNVGPARYEETLRRFLTPLM